MIEHFSDTPIKLVGAPDNIFATGPYPKPFEFNDDVARVFDDMVSRSVPMYREVNQATLQWAYQFAKENTNIYDIGCSTGTTIEAISRILPFKGNFIGIDNSKPMLKTAEKKLEEASKKHQIKFLCQDISKIKFENTSLAIMNYTLQFIPVAKRKNVLCSIFNGMNSNGVLILSEKIRSNNPEIQESMTKIYESFKYNSGYSKTEIERKKEALDNVLIPQTMLELMTMLKEAGFETSEPIIKWNNFVTLVAIKK